MGSFGLGPVVPVAAVDGVADHPAEYSACVGPAAESAGFLDMRGSFAEAAVNCLAYYRITLGTSEEIFSPNDVIPRWQMALFLARAARPAGIFLPTVSDQGFTDLKPLRSDFRDAINQLSQLRIMKGTSDTTFAPYEAVTRKQMAVLLSNFLRRAPTGPGGTNLSAIRPDDDVFTDLSDVDVNTYRAIREIFEVGVTAGTSESTFSPEAPLSRAQMAVFVARMLAHTNARPAGLTVQITDDEVFKDSQLRLAISLRDPSLIPIEEQRVDVFAATDPARAFDENGACTNHVTPAVGGGACIIRIADPLTDSLGNLVVDVEVGSSRSLRIWVWTDKVGKRYDNETAAVVVLDITLRSDASAVEVSDDLPPTAQKVKYGDPVTFTFRMVDDDGHPVARSGVEFTVTVRESRDGGRSYERTVITKETGLDGESQVTFRFTDPSPSRGDVARLDFDLRSLDGFEIVDMTTIRLVKNDRTNRDPILEWADEHPEPTTLELTTTKEFLVASSDGAGAAATVRAELTDQYGGPVAREEVVFTSNDPNGVPAGVRRTTNSAGVASLNYQRDHAGRSIETITARFGDLTSRARQYWVAALSEGASGTGSVRVFDTDENTIVLGRANDAILIEYDDNDHYWIGTELVTLSRFEQNLTIGDALAYEIVRSDPSTVNTYTLTKR
ncbi:MAG: S-layer homology domain-containing protein [bacterium]|nr:S-layer homology domain-containing protein [bacterium]MDE0289834.1 S-layer homology domain-containing protein [bacterium]MDE0438035.1 S-layer homology domain-containing protein [bacterium]